MGRIDSSTVVFFDASCLVALTSSPTGGAGYVWSLCERGFLRAAISRGVLAESERSLTTKFTAEYLPRLLTRVSACRPTIDPTELSEDPGLLHPTVNAKDAHVYQAAIRAGAEYLLTLDKRLEDEVRQLDSPLQAISPRDFIWTVLPNHPQVGLMRD